MAVARDDHLGIAFGSSFQDSVIGWIFPHDANRLRRLDHQCDPRHLSDGLLGPRRRPSELVGEYATELGEEGWRRD